jgi:hypothetical protein
MVSAPVVPPSDRVGLAAHIELAARPAEGDARVAAIGMIGREEDRHELVAPLAMTVAADLELRLEVDHDELGLSDASVVAIELRGFGLLLFGVAMEPSLAAVPPAVTAASGGHDVPDLDFGVLHRDGFASRDRCAILGFEAAQLA